MAHDRARSRESSRGDGVGGPQPCSSRYDLPVFDGLRGTQATLNRTGTATITHAVYLGLQIIGPISLGRVHLDVMLDQLLKAPDGEGAAASINNIAGDDIPDQASLSPSVDVSKEHHPERQESFHIKKEEEEEFLHIQEIFIQVQHPHVEEESQPPRVKKEEEESPLIKEEQKDITSLSGVHLKSEDEAEPPSSSSTGDGDHCGGSPADDLVELVSDSDQATSHSSDYEGESSGQKTGHSDKHWKCTQCGKTYRQRHGLKGHMAKHTGEKPFSCTICGKRFIEKGSLKSHTRTHTGEKPFCCSVCGERFSHRPTLRNHARIHTGEKPFSCSICGQKFGQKFLLKRHARIHNGEKPFSCAVCGQSFTEKGTLKLHARKHTGEKPFSCTICGQRFTEKGTLKLHARIHTGEKPFSCSICGKSFSRKGGLRIHTRTHTGEKPYSCSDCGQRFSEKFLLNRHARTHTVEKTLSCSSCGQPFFTDHLCPNFFQSCMASHFSS
ncbi:oocyte zinc finger protein XlCOF6-like isoform X2 [Corythoichthys intestinalis]|uniref:oocyte zinc finger protein XlCOF6-like isoform X2 n=2 Tax=Corythoichthys intestinalis TaxID=161448 RepID=UPI0025A53412|nr:oocyte zinc finger protein XlCOF6-like isoform X2 [Corythoichthys intestinalis]